MLLSLLALTSGWTACRVGSRRRGDGASGRVSPGALAQLRVRAAGGGAWLCDERRLLLWRARSAQVVTA